MLQSIRDRTQGWVAGIIISILILSFALWGVHSYMGAGGGNVNVATVNGVEITKNQLNAAYERLRRQLQMQLGSDSLSAMDTESNLKARSLQTLIGIEVVKQAALAEGYRISSRQVDNFIARIPEFQVNGQFSIARFQQLLSASLFSPRDFLDLIKTGLFTEQPRLGIILTSFALPNEVIDTVALVDQTRKIQYAILPQSAINKKNIIIPDDQVLAYYQQHQDEFKTPEKVSVEYIELSVKDLMVSQHATDKDLANFYRDNINSYAQPMQWKLEKIIIPLTENATDQEVSAAENKIQEIQQKIKQGAYFSTFAREFPGEKKSSNQRQEWLAVTQVPIEWQKPLSALTKRGQLSEPIRASNGIVLLKVIDIKESVTPPFRKVKEKVRLAFAHQQAQEKFADLREKLANTTYEHPDSLRPAADVLNLKVFVTGLFTRNKGNDDISTNTKFRDAAFSNDVLGSQNNSDVIQISPEAVAVLRIKSHVPAALIPLKAVQNQIVHTLTATELETRIQQLATEIQQKLQTGSNPAEVASSYHLTWQNTDFVGRNSSGKVSSAILYAAFRLPHHQANDNKNFYAIVKVPEGYAIVTSLAEQDGNSNTRQQQYDVFAEQVQNSQGLLEYGLYKQSLMNKAKIIIES